MLPVLARYTQMGGAAAAAVALPPDVLRHIFSFLLPPNGRPAPLMHVARAWHTLSLVCKGWSHIVAGMPVAVQACVPVPAVLPWLQRHATALRLAPPPRIRSPTAHGSQPQDLEWVQDHCGPLTLDMDGQGDDSDPQVGPYSQAAGCMLRNLGGLGASMILDTDASCALPTAGARMAGVRRVYQADGVCGGALWQVHLLQQPVCASRDSLAVQRQLQAAAHAAAGRHAADAGGQAGLCEGLLLMSARPGRCCPTKAGDRLCPREP